MSQKLKRIMSYWNSGLQFRVSDEDLTEAEAKKLFQKIERGNESEARKIIAAILFALLGVAYFFLR